MKLFNKIRGFFKNRSGAIAIEYGLGVALVVIASVYALNEMKRAARLSFYCSMPDQKNIHKDICKDMEGAVNSGNAIP